MKSLRPMIPRIRKELKSIPIDDLLPKKQVELPIEEKGEEAPPTKGNDKCQTLACDCESFVDQTGIWPKCARCGHQWEEHH